MAVPWDWGRFTLIHLVFWGVGRKYAYQFGVRLCVLSGVGLACANVCNHVVEDGGDDQGGDAEGQEGGGCLGDGDVEVLLHAVDAAGEESHTKHEQQVGKHTADKRGLHNGDLIFDQGLNGYDEFDSVTEWC